MKATEEQKAGFKEYQQNHKNKRRAYKKQYNKEHKQEISKYKKLYYQQNKEKIQKYYLANAEKTKQYSKDYYKSHKEEYMTLRIALKRDVLTHYGNGKCACVICNFCDIRALSIDHIRSNGKEHRRSMSNENICRWLKRNNYPDGYQTLCMNCQWIKRFEKKENNQWKIKSL